MYVSYAKLIERINDFKFDLTSISSDLKKLQKRVSQLEKALKEKDQ